MKETSKQTDALIFHLTQELYQPSEPKVGKWNRTHGKSISADRKHTVTFNKIQECF